MPVEAWIVLAILVVMFTLLAVTKLPAWVIFLGALTVTMTCWSESGGAVRTSLSR